MHIILFAPAGDPSSQSSDTLMSRQRIYAPLRVSGIWGALRSRRGAVDARWFSVCAPCLANCGGGGLSPVWSVAWWLDVLCVGGGGLLPFSLFVR